MRTRFCSLRRLRPPRAARTVPALGWSALLLVAGAVQPLPSAAAEPAPAAETSRAGSRAGEGRQRPGRGDDTGPGRQESDAGEPPDADGTHPESAPPWPPHPPPPSRHAALPGERTDEGAAEKHVERELPLGSGLILIGVGLGLAFLGLRLRRP